MFYVYLLQGAGGEDIYIGYTNDLRRRFKEHQALPKHIGWKLVYYEAYRSEFDARERERRLKHHGSGAVELKKRLEHSLSPSNWGGIQ